MKKLQSWTKLMETDLLALAEEYNITILDHEGHTFIPLRKKFMSRTANMVRRFNRLHGTSVSANAVAAKYKRVRNPEWAKMKNNIQKEKYRQARLNTSGLLYPDNPVEVAPEAPPTPNRSGISIAVVKLSRLLSENKIDEATFNEAIAQF